jgi:hypothetical protein
MLRKPIEYLDFDDNLLVEDFYFNLTLAEIAEMELGYENGLTHHLKRIIAAKDGAQIVATFKHIIAKAYGVRSDDGKRFMKSPELWEQFSQTNAYSVLFIELVTDAKKSAEFVVGIVPKEVAKKIAETEENQIVAAIDRAENSVPALFETSDGIVSVPIREDVRGVDNMTDDELLKVLASRRKSNS